jgi:hypothetical protein
MVTNAKVNCILHQGELDRLQHSFLVGLVRTLRPYSPTRYLFFSEAAQRAAEGLPLMAPQVDLPCAIAPGHP